MCSLYVYCCVFPPCWQVRPTWRARRGNSGGAGREARPCGGSQAQERGSGGAGGGRRRCAGGAGQRGDARGEEGEEEGCRLLGRLCQFELKRKMEKTRLWQYGLKACTGASQGFCRSRRHATIERPAPRLQCSRAPEEARSMQSSAHTCLLHHSCSPRHIIKTGHALLAGPIVPAPTRRRRGASWTGWTAQTGPRHVRQLRCPSAVTTFYSISGSLSGCPLGTTRGCKHCQP